MADEVIAKLTVLIESNIDDLVEGAEPGIRKLEKDLGNLGDKGEKELGRIEKGIGKLKTAFSALKGPVIAATAVIGGLTAAFMAANAAAERGIAGIRIRRSFQQLAANAGQSADEILSAMRRASAGTINEFTLMQQAATALTFRIAETPEQFERLTASAVQLGRARGLSPTETLERLIGGLGRREVELLDELGLNLVMINKELEVLAQQELGKPATALSAVEREGLFARAALNAAAKAAEALGGNVEDIGSSAEEAQIKIQNLQTQLDEASVVLTTKFIDTVSRMADSFFGPEGFFPLLSDGANIFAEVAASAVAAFGATAATIAQEARDVWNLLTGQITFDEFFESGTGLTERFLGRFTENFTAARDNIREEFSDIFAPGEGIEAIETPPIEPPPDDSVDKVKEILLDNQSELLDLQADLNKQAEELSEEHQERMLDIEEDFAEKRAKAAEDLQEELSELEADTAEDRAKIFKEAREDLARLEEDTDQELADERERFQTDERRETEDHLRDMRRLRERFLFDLEDAVKARDARAVVDLRRRFEMEQRTQTEDFEVKQSREREDQDERLRQIRENEQMRAQEIIQARDEELRQLMENENRKRAELQAGFEKEIMQLNEAEAKKLAEEQARFEERQAELDAALVERLTLIAQKLAEEKDINEEGAQQILGALSEYFGADGEIDKLMAAFRERMQARIDIEVGFEERSGSRGERRRSSVVERGGRPGRAFANGGAMVASPPGTMALFGERVPELAAFMPLDQMQRSANRDQNLNLNLALSGSAPPGIRSADRDAIAGVLVNALREAGLRRR